MSKAKEYNYIIPAIIKTMLDKKGLKIGAFATQNGYRAQELTDMLNGRKIIKATDIVKIAKALNVTPNDLFGMGKAI